MMEHKNMDRLLSVTTGLMSSTTTVTFRNASVLASSSPTPDEPVHMNKKWMEEETSWKDNTSSDENDLIVPI